MEAAARLPEGVPAPVAGRWANWSDWSTSVQAHSKPQAARPAVRAWGGGKRPATVPRRRYAIKTPASDGSGPLVSFTLAQTSRSFYLVGSTADGARARMMSIDRTSQEAGQRQPLDVQLDPPEYTSFLESRPSTKAAADEYLSALQRGDSKTFRRMEIWGLLGALRFTEGYYLVIIKEAGHVGRLGCHEIFRVEDMDLVQVSFEMAGWSMPRMWTSAETKNKQKLLGAHLEKDFYFSHTYDLTHSLQFNVCGVNAAASQARQWEPQSMFLWNHFLLSGLSSAVGVSEAEVGGSSGGQGFELVQAEMALAVICGFLSQKQLSLVGRTISLTLIARRSRHFAGTRYRKRGINNLGHVANDVETEQIVHHEANRVHPIGQHYTSFVQVRGSAPVYWSQETGLAVQPKIECNIIDPAHHATMLHFSDLMMRYGCPIVCLNLVKEGRDKSGLLESSAARRLDGEGDGVHREVKLANEYAEAFEHLNKSLPRNTRGAPLLEYTHRDLRRIKAEAAIDEAQKEQDPLTASMESMLQGAEVTLPGLEDLSVQVEKMGFFNSEDVRFGIMHNELHAAAAPARRQLQRGVVRSNCVDSLDRTNTAQFHLGLYALGHQLHALRVLPEKNGCTIGTSRLDLSDSDDKEITIVLAQLYEDMGNAIALQYGGSEAHQFMLAKLEGRSEFLGSVGDAYKSVRRYYANSISDQEKQGAINLFLGKFERQFDLMHRAEQVATHVDVWELGSDWQLHNREQDWPLPCQTGQHNEFFSGDLKWWEIALARYEQRVLALETGRSDESSSLEPLSEPEPEPEPGPGPEPDSKPTGETAEKATPSSEDRRRQAGLLPTYVFAQQYGLCHCDKEAKAKCNCPGVLTSFGGPGGDPGTVADGLMDDFAAKMAFVKQPYVTAEAKDIIDQEIEAETMQASTLMRGFDGTTESQMSWMSERPPPLPPVAAVDTAGLRPLDTPQRSNSAGRAAMQHRESIKVKHKLRREWIKEYIAQTEMRGSGEISSCHLLSEDDSNEKPGQGQRRLALDAANTYVDAHYMEIAAAEAAAAEEEQQLDRLGISRQTQDPGTLPSLLSDNKAIYENYVPFRQQRDAITAHLLHQMHPLTEDEARNGFTEAEAKAKADEKQAAEAKLNQMTLGALRDLCYEVGGLDRVTVETAVLSEDLGRDEYPSAAVAAAKAAARAEEDALGVRGWKESESWQSRKHSRPLAIPGESQDAMERLQEQLRRRVLEKLGRSFGRTPAPLFEPGAIQDASSATASQGHGVSAATAGQHTSSTSHVANASHVARDLQSCCDMTCGGSEWNNAKREHDLAKLVDARILEMLLGRHGLGVVDGGASESSTMTSSHIYELLVRGDAMDTLIEQRRATLLGSLVEDELIEEYAHSSESKSGSRGLRGRDSDTMSVDSDLTTHPAQKQEANETTAPVGHSQSLNTAVSLSCRVDSKHNEQDGGEVTHRTSSMTANPSPSADLAVSTQEATKLFEVGGDYDSLLCRVGGVSKAHHRLMVPGPGHFHAEYNRQRTEDEAEIVENYRDDAFLTGVLTTTADAPSGTRAVVETERAEGLKLLIELQLGDDISNAGAES